MILYNVTCSVDQDIAEEWISWMKDKHIPDALKSGLFVDCKILKVLTHDDDQTFSFAVQYYSNSIKDIEKYITLDDETQKRYGNKVLTYASLLKEV